MVSHENSSPLCSGDPAAAGNRSRTGGGGGKCVTFAGPAGVALAEVVMGVGGWGGGRGRGGDEGAGV